MAPNVGQCCIWSLKYVNSQRKLYLAPNVVFNDIISKNIAYPFAAELAFLAEFFLFIGGLIALVLGLRAALLFLGLLNDERIRLVLLQFAFFVLRALQTDIMDTYVSRRSSAGPHRTRLQSPQLTHLIHYHLLFTRKRNARRYLKCINVYKGTFIIPFYNL